MGNYLTSNKTTILSVVLSFLFTLSACRSESIVVPETDSTPPIVSMAVDFTTSRGQRMTIDVTQDSNDVSFELDPEEPIAVLASGKDTDGGVMGVMLVFHIFDVCDDNVLGNDFGSGPADIPNTGGPGDTAPTLKLEEFTFDPLDSCPSGNSRAEGSISAYAENFHNGSAETATFNFEYR